MTKALILDIENTYKGYLFEMVNAYCEHITTIGVCESLSEAKRYIDEEAPDILFFDTFLPDGADFHIPKEVSAVPFIVLVTASSQVAVDAIRTNVYDCLLKPVVADELIRVEQRIIEAVNERRKEEAEDWRAKKIAVNDSSGIRLIDIPNIVFLEAQGNYTNIYLTEDGAESVICISKTLKHFETELPGSIFFRVHKSSIVNVDRVSAYKNASDDHLVMDTGHEVAVSRRRSKSFREFLSNKVV